MNKILYAITTYDAYAYVDLSIHMHKKWGNDVIVIDDGSCSKKLHDVCIKYNVPLFGIVNNPAKKFDEGDVISTVQAIHYAYANGYTHVVKQSRRWICLENPTPSLNVLIDESGGVTFSNYTKTWGFGFRTQFCGYEVKTWINCLEKIYNSFRRNENLGLVEHYIHLIAESNEPQTEKYKKYKLIHNNEDKCKGFVGWNWMGNDKKNTPSYILWHNNNTPSDYYNKAKNQGLNYTLDDFKIPDSHKQKLLPR